MNERDASVQEIAASTTVNFTFKLQLYHVLTVNEIISQKHFIIVIVSVYRLLVMTAFGQKANI